MYVCNIAREKFPRLCECNVMQKGSQGRCVYVIRYVASVDVEQCPTGRDIGGKVRKERDQTPLKRSKRRRAEQDIKVFRSVEKVRRRKCFCWARGKPFYRIEEKGVPCERDRIAKGRVYPKACCRRV
jgi:hypothetical protein